MGSPKAALEWHGSTLLRRVTGIVARALDGPVIVVRAAGQELPQLDPAVEIAVDAREGRGPLEGLAAGFAAVGDRAAVAYLSSTDVPLLHPLFVRDVVDALDADHDVALPEIAGFRQPLAAAYRVELRATVEELLAAGRTRPAFLFERCRVLALPAEAMLRDAALARLDPALDSVSNLNEPADYERLHALPAPEVRVERLGSPVLHRGPRRAVVRAWTLGAAAAEVGVTLDAGVGVELNGERVARDPQFPLVAGDTVALATAEPAV